MAGKDKHNGDDEFLHKLRHSAAHVMAEAVLQLYPDAKIAIGPAIDTGFYYDFDLGKDEQGGRRPSRPKTSRRSRSGCASRSRPRTRSSTGRSRPTRRAQLFEGQPYKEELIDGLAKGGLDDNGNEIEGPVTISTYRHGEFEDLCRGPHVEHTGQIPPDAFKLMTVAGAYWRGDEHNPMLQRIYGTAWRNKDELQQYLDDAGGGQEARPPRAGPAARHLHLRRGGRAGPAAVAAQRRAS